MKLKGIISVFIAACLGGIIALGAYDYIKDEPAQTSVQDNPIQYVNVPKVITSTDEVMDFTLAAEKTVNSVVHIKTEYEVATQPNSWFEMFNPHSQLAVSSGSGVIIGSDGYIVTNNHVIDGASEIEVVLNNNKTYRGEIIGTDPATDLAIVKINAENLPSIFMGNSDDLKIGEWVLAVGNPFSLTSTVTAGIVSAKGRNINLLEVDPSREIFPIESFIQTDAAVNPGNSGGALVNTNGELVGINTAIASRTGSYAGYSFAVPVSIVKKVANDLLEFGSVQRAFIGVSITDLNQDIAEQLGVKEIQGVLVRGLTPGGAAAEVGIETGDIILSVEGIKVNSVPELQEKVNQFRPGDRVNVRVKRDGEIMNFGVKLRNKNGNTELASEFTADKIKTKGAILAIVSAEELKKLSLSNGVKVIKDEDGHFRRSGIREGFIITKIDKKKVEKPKDVETLLNSSDGGVLIEGKYPNGTRAYYGFGL